MHRSVSAGTFADIKSQDQELKTPRKENQKAR